MLTIDSKYGILTLIGTQKTLEALSRQKVPYRNVWTFYKNNFLKYCGSPPNVVEPAKENE